jgi:hypothetical protein
MKDHSDKDWAGGHEETPYDFDGDLYRPLVPHMVADTTNWWQVDVLTDKVKTAGVSRGFTLMIYEGEELSGSTAIPEMKQGERNAWDSEDGEMFDLEINYHGPFGSELTFSKTDKEKYENQETYKFTSRPEYSRELIEEANALKNGMDDTVLQLLDGRDRPIQAFRLVAGQLGLDAGMETAMQAMLGPLYEHIKEAVQLEIHAQQLGDQATTSFSPFRRGSPASDCAAVAVAKVAVSYLGCGSIRCCLCAFLQVQRQRRTPASARKEGKGADTIDVDHEIFLEDEFWELLCEASGLVRKDLKNVVYGLVDLNLHKYPVGLDLKKGSVTDRQQNKVKKEKAYGRLGGKKSRRKRRTKGQWLEASFV